MVLHAPAPSLDILGPCQPFAEHDLIVAGIGVEEHLEAPGRKLFRDHAGTADIDEEVRRGRNPVKSLPRHPETGLMQMEVVPALAQVRGVGLEKAPDVVGRVIPLRGVGLLHRMVGPTPGVLMVEHLMPETRQPHDILEVVPGHSAYRV